MTEKIEAVQVDEFMGFVPESCPQSRCDAVAYFLAELSQIATLHGVIERVEKSLSYYRERTPNKLGQYGEIYRSAISAWGEATGAQVWAYPLMDMSNEPIRAELLQQLDSMAKVQATEAKPTTVEIKPELAEMTFEQLQGKRSKDVSFAKLEKQ
ncbi:MAG: hypothetical protein HC824_11310 [Synechococcales cyanobacterium RM1_1_8]|nr:hypothetical protein [Synechococcales cyanobacterium RM1_1_8]